MKKVIRVGSRESKLAVIQARIVIDSVKRFHPDIEFELVTMKTTGDKILDRNLDQIGGKGLFVKELDRALYDNRVDVTVHSLKDLPMEDNKDLPLIGFTHREDPRDAMIIDPNDREFNTSGIIGSSSRRRIEQLKKIYPNAGFKSIRGNVQTRLKKLETENYSATVLAMAGLERLGMSGIAYRIFETDEVIPAAGQGILAIQGRAGEDHSIFGCILSKKSRYQALAERGFVRALDGGCSSPIAAYADVNDNELSLRGLYYNSNRQDYIVGVKNGKVENAEKIGIALAYELKQKFV